MNVNFAIKSNNIILNDSERKVKITEEVINLFLTTNTRITKEMIEKILMKGQRSTYNITIFLQKDSGTRMFNKKGIKV